MSLQRKIAEELDLQQRCCEDLKWCTGIPAGSIFITYIIMKHFFEPLLPTETADPETESVPQPHMVK